MKTNTATLSQAPGQSLLTAAAEWLSTENSFATAMMGCKFSNCQFFGLLLCGCLSALVLILASMSSPDWGWIAFFALSALICAAPGIRNIYYNMPEE